MNDSRQENTDIRLTPIRKSVTRPNLVMGCDRELFIVATGTIGSVIMMSWEVRATIVGLILWMFVVACLHRMAKADPRIRQKYLRSLDYSKYYPPHSTPFHKNKSAKNARQ